MFVSKWSEYSQVKWKKLAIFLRSIEDFIIWNIWLHFDESLFKKIETDITVNYLASFEHMHFNTIEKSSNSQMGSLKKPCKAVSACTWNKTNTTPSKTLASGTRYQSLPHLIIRTRIYFDRKFFFFASTFDVCKFYNSIQWSTFLLLKDSNM